MLTNVTIVLIVLKFLEKNDVSFSDYEQAVNILSYYNITLEKIDEKFGLISLKLSNDEKSIFEKVVEIEGENISDKITKINILSSINQTKRKENDCRLHQSQYDKTTS